MALNYVTGMEKQASLVAQGSVLALIFLAMVVPTAYIAAKAVLLCICFLYTGGSVLAGRYRLNNTTVIAISILSLYGALNSIHGFIDHNPGALRVLTVYSVWPLVYCFFSGLLCGPQSLEYLCRTLWIALWCVVLYALSYIGHKAGIVPDWAYIKLDLGQGLGVYDGYDKFTLYSVSSLLFLTPFAMHRVYLDWRDGKTNYPSMMLIALAAVVTVFSGRRALLLILVETPLSIWLSNKICRVETRNVSLKNVSGFTKKIAALIIFGMIIATVGYFFLAKVFNVGVFVTNFLEGFDFASGTNASIRADQFSSLLDGWVNAGVLFGAGNGAVASVIRSQEMPWSYELTYVYLLFSTGVVGLLFYFSIFGWGLFRLRNVFSSDLAGDGKLVAALVTGVVGLALGAASNPYFGKFDFLWIVLLPHLLIGGLKFRQRLNGGL